MNLKIPDEVGGSLGALLYVVSKKDIVLYMQALIESGYLTKDYLITEKGKKELSKIKITKIPQDQVLKLAEDYRNCFRTPSGKSLAPGVTGDLKLLTDRLKEFVEEHPQYSREHILKAIKLYIQSQTSTNFKYLQKAHFTVKKQNSDKTTESRLLTYCEELDNEENGNDEEFGKDV